MTTTHEWAGHAWRVSVELKGVKLWATMIGPEPTPESILEFWRSCAWLFHSEKNRKAVGRW